MTDYTTTALIKTALSITDSSRDTPLGVKATSASRAIDRMCGRPASGFAPDAAATARVYQPQGHLVWRGGSQILLTDEISTTTSLVIATGTTSGTTWTTVASTGYELQYSSPLGDAGPITGALRSQACWAYAATDRIQVTAKWGYPSVPEDIAEAALILACRLFKRKDSPEGVLGSADWGVMRVARADPDVAALLAPFQSAGIA